MSHQLMMRAGLIRQLTAGVYSFLPLGCRVLKKVEDLIRREMDKSGAQEVLLPSMQPGDLWHHSGRWDDYGSELIRFSDRQGRSVVLGPTHEEVITSLVQNEIHSYRQLPLTLYQIQTKFRDEPRPRAGLLRAREFRMKDAYSFDVDETGLAETYTRMHAAYCRIFAALGVHYLAVEADAGTIGGNGETQEFMVISNTGEDTLVKCTSCSYAANVEVANVDSGTGQSESTCSRCGGNLEFLRGIEVGHIFKLGTVYSKAFGATFLDDTGASRTLLMGCYGIGTSRLLPAIIEQCHDEDGIIWPTPIAPFQVHVVMVNAKDATQKDAATNLYERLTAVGLEILLDDRTDRPGVKFKDADLLGLPLCVTVGNHVSEGTVEVKERKSGDRYVMPVTDVVHWCQAFLNEGRSECVAEHHH